jgi:hypothetical protein
VERRTVIRTLLQAEPLDRQHSRPEVPCDCSKTIYQSLYDIINVVTVDFIAMLAGTHNKAVFEKRGFIGCNATVP